MDTQNDTLHDDYQHYDTQQNYCQHIKTQHNKNQQYDVQHDHTQHYVIQNNNNNLLQSAKHYIHSVLCLVSQLCPFS